MGKNDKRLEMLERTISEVAQRLREIESAWPKERKLMNVVRLMSLPEHLRTTASIVVKLGEATAVDVAKRSGRQRTLESMYLNELVRLGHAGKVKRGKEVFYRVNYAVT